MNRRTEWVSDRSEGRFQTLVENVRDYAIFMLDADGFVTEWTEGARRVKGYAAEEVLGRHVSMFYAREEIAAGDPERELAEAAEEGRAEREAWRVRKGGERIWVNEIATAVRDGEGRLLGFTKISRDLTERWRAEEALRESEQRLRRPPEFVCSDDDAAATPRARGARIVSTAPRSTVRSTIISPW